MIQREVLATITSHTILNNLLNFEAQQQGNAYTIDDLFTDLEAGMGRIKKLCSNRHA